MKTINAADISVGTELPSLVLPPITRKTLAVYCGASGDHNPIHVDIDFAHDAGLDDVIAHGMLIMSYLGRQLTSWIPQQLLKSFNSRFLKMTHVGDVITVSGVVVNKFLKDGQCFLSVELKACDQKGEIKISGNASIILI